MTAAAASLTALTAALAIAADSTAPVPIWGLVIWPANFAASSDTICALVSWPVTSAAGLRRWLVCAYRATFNSPYGEVQNLHRLVLRALRQMHGDALPSAKEMRAQRHYA